MTHAYFAFPTYRRCDSKLSLPRIITLPNQLLQEHSKKVTELPCVHGRDFHYSEDNLQPSSDDKRNKFISYLNNQYCEIQI